MKAILRSINNFNCKIRQKVSNNKLKTVSDNGNVVIEDAIVKSAKDYKVYGNTYQDTTNGVQLVDLSNPNLSSLITNWSFSNDILEIQSSSAKYASITYKATKLIKDNPGKTICFNYEKLENIGDGQGAVVQLNITYSDNTNNGYKNLCTRSGNKQSYTIPDDISNISSVYIGIYTNNSTTAHEGHIKITQPLIYFGELNNPPAYELYTGGQPSPNPDYPQEIVSCGDKTKNIFDKNNISWYRNNNSEFIDERQNSTTRIRTNSFKIEGGKTYIISGYPSNITFTSIRCYDGEQNYIENASTKTGDIFSLNENVKYIHLLFGGNNFNDSTNELMKNANIQIEEGSTATSYEPYYEGYKIPINVRSDNLATNFGIGWYNGNNSIFTNNENFRSCVAKIKPNTTITISKKNSSNRFVVITSENKIEPNGAYKRIILTESNTNRTQYTFTSNDDENYLFFGYYAGIDEAEIEQSEEEIMIVEGSTVPFKYISYYNQTTNIYLDEPLRKIGDYADYIDFKNGKIVRNIKEFVLDGSEDWKMLNLTFYLQGNFPKTLNSLCTHFIKQPDNNWVSSDTVYKGKFTMFNVANQLKIMPIDDGINTLALWKTWLSNNLTTVYYPLETPTEEDIELPELNLIEDKNIITIGTELKSNIKVEYYSKEIVDISNYKYNLRKVED